MLIDLKAECHGVNRLMGRHFFRQIGMRPVARNAEALIVGHDDDTTV